MRNKKGICAFSKCKEHEAYFDGQQECWKSIKNWEQEFDEKFTEQKEVKRVIEIKPWFSTFQYPVITFLKPDQDGELGEEIKSFIREKLNTVGGKCV